MTNKKSHVRFRFTPMSITLDDWMTYKFELFLYFLGFRRFWSQQQLNEWR